MSWLTMMIAGGVRRSLLRHPPSIANRQWKTGAMRLRMDLAYDGSGFHGWARQDGLRTVQGELEAALATVLRRAVGRGDAARAAPTPACMPAARSPTSTSRIRAWSRPSCVVALDGVLPDDISRTPRGRRPRRLRRPLLGGVAPLRLPDRRPARVRRPADARARARLAATPRPRRDRPGLGAAARPPRLRVVLQAARGRDDDPHAPGPLVGTRRRRRSWSGPSAPTPSATTWCARSSAASSRSARAGGRRRGQARCSPRRRATRRSPWCRPTG